jgi:hypothetical protein
MAVGLESYCAKMARATFPARPLSSFAANRGVLSGLHQNRTLIFPVGKSLLSQTNLLSTPDRPHFLAHPSVVAFASLARRSSPCGDASLWHALPPAALCATRTLRGPSSFR